MRLRDSGFWGKGCWIAETQDTHDKHVRFCKKESDLIWFDLIYVGTTIWIRSQNEESVR